MLFFPKKNIRVSVRNKKTVIETKSGVNLYKFLLEEKIIQPTLCGGNGQCGKCKILFIGNNIPKPTYKESLILAKVNIEAGYRLACEHKVKKDIEIDTSEMIALSPEIYDDYPKALEDPGKVTTITQTKKTEENTSSTEENIDDEEVIQDNNEDALQIEETISINDFQPEASKKRPEENKDDEGPSDGVFMIQQRGGVRHYCYSASLDNIVSEGFAETSEHLSDVVDNSLVPDFIHNVLKIRDMDRVLILMEHQNIYPVDNILGIMSYHRFDIGTLLCEVIMPIGANHNAVRFLRLLNAAKDNKLTFSLDMLDRVYYLKNDITTDITFNGLITPNILAIFPRGKNAITDFDENLNHSNIDKKGHEPDGISLSAFLKLVKLMHKKGIIDNNFTIKSAGELSKQGLPLALTVRITQKDGISGFYAYSSRESELIVTQHQLDALAEIRSYIITMIRFAQEKIGRVSGLTFHTGANHDNLINFMFDLGFIPKEFADRVVYQPGDATAHAIKLFKEKDTKTFIQNNFGTAVSINATDDDIFMKKAKDTGLIKQKD